MSGIRVSEKHGVNPSIQKCFWCGGDIGVVLFGKMKGDKEAPREVILDYSLCNECKEKEKTYVHVIEASKIPDYADQPEIAKDTYPTGRNMWIKDEAVMRLLSDKDLAARIIAHRAMFCDSETFNALIAMHDEAEAAHQEEEAKSREYIASVSYPVTSRKEWVCHKCEKKIKKGEAYARLKVKVMSDSDDKENLSKIELRKVCVDCYEKMKENQNV